MGKYFRDIFSEMQEYTLESNKDIFESILNERKREIDSKRFFLEYIPPENLAEYDFTNPDSLKKFRNTCFSFRSPRIRMGGCNLDPEMLEEDIRYAGIKMSDPYRKILGSFDTRNGIITYSPLFPNFDDERDLIKFANDHYFTPMSFEDIMMVQIDNAREFQVHVGNYRTAQELIKYGRYIFEKVTKDQMVKFVLDPEEGAKIHQKVYKY